MLVGLKVKDWNFGKLIKVILYVFENVEFYIV